MKIDEINFNSRYLKYYQYINTKLWKILLSLFETKHFKFHVYFTVIIISQFRLATFHRLNSHTWLPYQLAGPKKCRLSSTKEGTLFSSVHPVPAQCPAYIFVREKRERGRNKNGSYLRNKGIGIVRVKKSISKSWVQVLTLKFPNR